MPRHNTCYYKYIKLRKYECQCRKIRRTNRTIYKPWFPRDARWPCEALVLPIQRNRWSSVHGGNVAFFTPPSKFPFPSPYTFNLGGCLFLLLLLLFVYIFFSWFLAIDLIGSCMKLLQYMLMMNGLVWNSDAIFSGVGVNCMHACMRFFYLTGNIISVWNWPLHSGEYEGFWTLWSLY